MESTLVRCLRCPSCGGDFQVKVLAEGDGDIEEGLLACAGCGRLAPIIAGVPRILPPYLNRALVSRFPEFFQAHGVRIPLAPPANRFERLNQAIFDAFGYPRTAPPSILRRVSGGGPEHERPFEYEERGVFNDNVAPADDASFRGKLGVDVGCNLGRHVYGAHKRGAEIIGLEQTFAVDRARTLLRRIPGVHLVQGSIFEFPFKPDLVDFAMCFGVLHHTPDARGGFRTIAACVKPGGVFFTMLYGLDEMPWVYRLSHLRALRALTTRMSLRGTRKVCEGLGFVMKYGVCRPLEAISRIPGLGGTAARFPFIYLGREPVVAISRSFFDRLAPPVTTFHTRPEIEEWYREAGFAEVRVSRRSVNSWRGYGVRAG
jgi:SAM-dependent methyltransferase/uncharacterized protein YbaR (Trm112 family)